MENDRFQRTIDLVLLELFFAFVLPLATLWSFWGEHVAHIRTHDVPFYGSPELSVCALVIYGLVIARIITTIKITRISNSLRKILCCLLLFSFSLILVAKVCHGSASAAYFQVINLIVAIIVFLIWGGHAIAHEPEKRTKNDTDHGN